MFKEDPSTPAPPDAGRIEDHFFSQFYEELHCMAVRELRRNSAAALSATTLVHETFLNISRGSAVMEDRPRFLAYASRAMRGLIIDSIRRGNAKKRGHEFQIVPFTEDLELQASGDIEVERLRDALEALSVTHPRLAQCVDLKFFCGFSFSDIARLWNVSERTVLRDWDKARLLLHRLIGGAAFEPQLDS
jgi:RNA polymerase sigma factor (TIGR02999 family)